MLLKQQPYQDLGGYFDQRQQQRTLHRLQHRAEQLGYQLNQNLSPLRLLTARFSKQVY